MQTIYLDISNKGVIPCIQAKQSEVGRKFLAVITDNGVSYNIPLDTLISVWYEGSMDAGNYSSINEKSAFTIDGNKVAVELVAQMLMKPGDGDLCLSLSSANGNEINTWNIPYHVEYKPGAGSHVPTEYYTALTEAAAEAATVLGEAKSYAERAETAAETATEAAIEAAAPAVEAAQNAAEEAEQAKKEAEQARIAAEAATGTLRRAYERSFHITEYAEDAIIDTKEPKFFWVSCIDRDTSRRYVFEFDWFASNGTYYVGEKTVVYTGTPDGFARFMTGSGLCFERIVGYA